MSTVSMRAFRDRLRKYHTTRGERVIFGRFEDHIIRADERITFIRNLEGYAREVGVLHPDETVDHAPRCSRCKSRTPIRRRRWNYEQAGWVLVEPPQYHRQCERCFVWSRATRHDPLRCLDCRRWVDPAIEALSEEDREFYRRHGGRGIRRCQACNGSKLTREQRQREIDGQYNPLSPYFEG